MKQYLTAALLWICLTAVARVGLSQDAAAKKARPEVAFDTASVAQYHFSGLGYRQAFLQMDYGRSEILNPSSIGQLKDESIEKVQLVFSRYPKNTDLTALNRRRLDSLFALWPQLFANPSVKWELVEQSACPSEAAASKLFHGFSIQFAPPAVLEEDGSGLSGAKKMELLMDGRLKPQDSTILRVMDRNRQWKDILVVADLTGSMSPYIGQLLLWVKLNANTRPAKYFVFFNDGDGKSDFEKEIGRTGGIYHTDAEDLRAILETAKETMRQGFGGDEAENNLEAVLFGIQQYPEFREVVMIADNWATPRDMELVSAVSVPVRVVLCGTTKGINPRYLDLARATNGSVHTIEDDLDNLMSLNEGGTIEVDGHIYRVEKGKFKLVR
jgi:hypothetical protein